VGEGVAGWVAQRAESVIIQDKWTDPRYKYVLELRGEDYVSFASVPIVARAGHVVGVINVHARRPGHFGAHDVSILADIANLMADAVENARLHTRLAQREAELEGFAEHTLQLHESERQRLARGDPRTG
jgi:GAF domain-containing protein